MNKLKMPLSGWGNHPSSTSNVSRPEYLQQLKAIHSDCQIARGLGRSYGDAALNDKNDVVLTERLNRYIDFNSTSGRLTAEAGVSFRDILETFVPRGWFPPVTPGTQDVTLGGCIAADVHGKNHHHDGSIGRYIENLILRTANGNTQFCSREQNSELFFATIGGMGLTGIIIEATLQLIPIESAYMIVTHTPTNSLKVTINRLLINSKEKYSVAWVDMQTKGKEYGRSVIMTGHHATLEEVEGNISSPLLLKAQRSLSIPIKLPSWLLNRWNMPLFNKMYFALQCRRKESSITDCRSFFYPLDRIKNWNRCYGKKGFIQYQCVLPLNSAYNGYAAIFEELAKANFRPFLAVMKKFGTEGEGLLSFPKEGISLSIDIPRRNSALMPLLDRLDELVIKHGGRCYLAKDARMKPETFQAMYPKLDQWLKIKRQVDPRGIYASDLSRRLGLTS